MRCYKIGVRIAEVRTASGLEAHFPCAQQEPIGIGLTRDSIGFTVGNIKQAREELRLHIFHAAFKFVGHNTQLLPASMELFEGFRHPLEFARQAQTEFAIQTLKITKYLFGLLFGSPIGHCQAR